MQDRADPGFGSTRMQVGGRRIAPDQTLPPEGVDVGTLICALRRQGFEPPCGGQGYRAMAARRGSGRSMVSPRPGPWRAGMAG